MKTTFLIFLLLTISSSFSQVVGTSAPNTDLESEEYDLTDEQKETLEKIIIRSLFGNINASRNSA